MSKNTNVEEQSFPAALQKLSSRGFFMAGAILFLLIFTLCWQKPNFKSALPFCIAVLLLVAYVAYTAYHLRTEWRKGEIISHVALCRSVKCRKYPRDSKEVIFVIGEGAEQKAHVFNLPDRRNKDLFPGFWYTLYVRASDPNHLLAYQEIYVPSDAEGTEEVKAEEAANM